MNRFTGNYPRPPYPAKRRFEPDRDYRRPDPSEESPVTETESSYLKSLIDSRSKVTVKLVTGETFQGRIRYYDKDCFSLGLTTEKRRLFLRKENISYISEE
jgi:sRNA-binding regulator protein Hfq